MASALSSIQKVDKLLSGLDDSLSTFEKIRILQKQVIALLSAISKIREDGSPAMSLDTFEPYFSKKKEAKDFKPQEYKCLIRTLNSIPSHLLTGSVSSRDKYYLAMKFEREVFCYVTGYDPNTQEISCVISAPTRHKPRDYRYIASRMKLEQAKKLAKDTRYFYQPETLYIPSGVIIKDESQKIAERLPKGFSLDEMGNIKNENGNLGFANVYLNTNGEVFISLEDELGTSKYSTPAKPEYIRELLYAFGKEREGSEALAKDKTFSFKLDDIPSRDEIVSKHTYEYIKEYVGNIWDKYYSENIEKLDSETREDTLLDIAKRIQYAKRPNPERTYPKDEVLFTIKTEDSTLAITRIDTGKARCQGIVLGKSSRVRNYAKKKRGEEYSKYVEIKQSKNYVLRSSAPDIPCGFNEGTLYFPPRGMTFSQLFPKTKDFFNMPLTVFNPETAKEDDSTEIRIPCFIIDGEEESENGREADNDVRVHTSGDRGAGLSGNASGRLGEISDSFQNNDTPEGDSGRDNPNALIGRKTKLFIPSGTKINVIYEVVSLDKVHASHDPTRDFTKDPEYKLVNERDYFNEVGSRDKVIEHASKLEPMLLMSAPDCSSGAPVVDFEGNVLGGNSRLMSIRLAFKNGDKVKRYKQALIEEAPYLGLSVQAIERLEKPVLIRRIPTQLKAEERQKLVVDLNLSFTAAKTVTAEAKSRSQNVTPGTISLLCNSMKKAGSESLKSFLDLEASSDIVAAFFEDGVFEKQSDENRFLDQEALKNDKYLLTPEGKTFLSQVLRSRVSKDYSQLANLPASILLKIDMSIPYIIDLESTIKSIGGIPKEDRDKWSLDKPMQDALDMVVDFERAKANGNAKTADGYLSTQNMVYGMQTPQERFGIKAASIFRCFETETRAKDFAYLIKKYASAAKTACGGLLGTGDPKKTFNEVFLEGRSDNLLGMTGFVPRKKRPKDDNDKTREQIESLKQIRDGYLDFKGKAGLQAMVTPIKEKFFKEPQLMTKYEELLSDALEHIGKMNESRED